MFNEHSYKSLFGFTRKCEIEIILRNEDHDGIPIVIAPGFLILPSNSGHAAK